MIAFNRMANIAPGKTIQGIAFAHEIRAHMLQAFKVDLEVMLPIGGNPQRIAWSTRYADLAALDKVNLGVQSDKKFWEILNNSADCFIGGSMHDSIWRGVN